jgi:hypothetical protein
LALETNLLCFPINPLVARYLSRVSDAPCVIRLSASVCKGKPGDLHLVDKTDRKVLERRIEAQCRLPALHSNADPKVNFRTVIIEREGLGIRPLSDKTIQRIEKIGYDAFFVDLMNVAKATGSESFFKLSKTNNIEFTIEYIVFHHFRERLNASTRKRIAALLLSEAQKMRK